MTDERTEPAAGRLLPRFSLRTLFSAVTIWSLLLVGFTAFGLVEIIDVCCGVCGLIFLDAVFRREFIDRRRYGPAVFLVTHVTVTLVFVILAYAFSPSSETTLNLTTITAWIAMFPVVLLHHLSCRWYGWHSGLAQPGTFFLMSVLCSLLWLGTWSRFRTLRAGRAH